MTEHSLERINPDLVTAGDIMGDKTLLLHLERYRYAAKWMLPGSVLDIACGVGYGTDLLASAANDSFTSITGVDIDAGSINYAMNRYSNSRIRFVVADAMTYIPSNPVQTIISLETIEHLREPFKFVQHISQYLSPGGRYIASVPITPSMDANPYHLHDFSAGEFRKLFTTNGFEELDSFVQVQKFNPFELGKKGNSRTADLRKNIPGYYLKHPGKLFLRIKSLLTDGFSNKYLVAVFEKKV